MNHQMIDTENQTFVESQRRDEVIRSATQHRLPATMTRFGSGGWTSYRTRFLSCDARERNIWIVQPMRECQTEALTLRAGEQIGVSFRHRRSKCSFSSVVIGTVAARCGSGVNAYKAVIQWPENLQEMQRRVYRRVSPPTGQRIDVSYWLAEIPPASDNGEAINPSRALARPDDSNVHIGRLLDLSAGGLRVASDEPLGEFVPGARVICEFSLRSGDAPLRLETRLQHIEPASNGRRSIGFQFVGLDTSAEGQCRLAQLASIVTAFRRAHGTELRPSLSAGVRSR